MNLPEQIQKLAKSLLILPEGFKNWLIDSEWFLLEIGRAQEEHFYGSITLNFEKGAITTLRKEQTIKRK